MLYCVFKNMEVLFLLTKSKQTSFSFSFLHFGLICQYFPKPLSFFVSVLSLCVCVCVCVCVWVHTYHQWYLMEYLNKILNYFNSFFFSFELRNWIINSFLFMRNGSKIHHFLVARFLPSLSFSLSLDLFVFLSFFFLSFLFPFVYYFLFFSICSSSLMSASTPWVGVKGFTLCIFISFFSSFSSSHSLVLQFLSPFLGLVCGKHAVAG